MTLCTFSVTAQQPYFQEIYICYTCCDGENPTTCICQACACEDACHKDHDVQLIGVGPCYCDCSVIGDCKLLYHSNRKATELGCRGCVPAATTKRISIPRFDVYQLCPWNETLSSDLVAQALELVQHSKSTFWLDSDFVHQHGNDLSSLEIFAWNIFQRHTRHYNLHNEDEATGPNILGAEWWVQSKGVVQNTDNASYSNADTAIDLHYDKDETVAEVFDLGFFPTLSTVSYLGSVEQQYFGAAPTVVLNQQYEDSLETGIREMLISHPAPGKHLVFDGRMLHGAPAHTALCQTPIEDSALPKQRITFLVNIWIRHRPCDALTLPGEIREKLRVGQTAAQFMKEPCVFVQETNIPEFVIGSKNEEAARIQLPFVGGSSTWADAVGEHCEELVVSVVVPPKEVLDVSTALVHFEGQCEAFISYSE